jgi:hypothetical protein
MKSHHVTLIALSLLALAGCSKKRTRRAEVVECSSISLDAKGTTQCLVQLYHWKPAEAQQVAAARANEMDSLKTWQEDSVWALGAAKHKRDLPLRRVNTTTDSIWKSELPKHRKELQACMAKRDFNLSSCLTLYYKWDSDRALATADSVTRARLGR